MCVTNFSAVYVIYGWAVDNVKLSGTTINDYSLIIIIILCIYIWTQLQLVVCFKSTDAQLQTQLIAL